MKHTFLGAVAALVASTALATSADAALFGFQTFNGNVKNSNDGACDGDAACDGLISASTEAGSSVLAAYLYTSRTPSGSTPTTVELDGNPLSFTDLGPNDQGLEAFRAEVTSIVKPKVDASGGGIVDFTYGHLDF